MTPPNLHIRPYKNTDYDSCLRIFKSNVPQYFDESEISEFEEFLVAHASESYWVIEQNDIGIGCGGIRVRSDSSGGLSYGMIDHRFHRNGIGKALTNFRILQLLDSPDLVTITLDTSQHTYAFYQRFGFEVTNIRKDFYGEGLDCYSMNLSLPDSPLAVEKLKEKFLKECEYNFFQSNIPTFSLQPPSP